jgi:hypothetical protein
VRGSNPQATRVVCGHCVQALSGQFKWGEWTLNYPSTPQQKNGNDCGVFVCVFAFERWRTESSALLVLAFNETAS